MPLAAALDADDVSSDRCAHASNPVIVYWVSRKPNGTTASQKAGLVTLPSLHPEALYLSVKTKLNDWCVSGTTIRISTIAVAPITCHHTDTLFMIAIRWPLKMFSTLAS